MKNQLVCPGCKINNFRKWLDVDVNYQIIRCKNCDLALMNSLSQKDIIVDYSDYGDHITNQSESYFSARSKNSFKKNIFFSLMKFFLPPKNTKILDFGGGAGFFAKSCMNAGFKKTFLVEPSNNFRFAAVNRVGLERNKVFPSIQDLPEYNFDLIAMLDVIEHLPIESINSIIEDLSSRLRPGGYLFGFTPNSNSLNIKFHGAKDPSIDPPRHVFYFNRSSIDQILTAHGFKKTLSFTFGFKVNSFFRVKKDCPSWVEKPSNNQRPFAGFIKLIFKILDLPISIFGCGYHVFFIYKLQLKK